jgi:hypothetical protein
MTLVRMKLFERGVSLSRINGKHTKEEIKVTADQRPDKTIQTSRRTSSLSTSIASKASFRRLPFILTPSTKCIVSPPFKYPCDGNTVKASGH